MFRKCEAQCAFAEACALMGYEKRIKQEVDKYAKEGWFRAKIENAVADTKTDTIEELQERLRCQRAATSYDIETLLYDLILLRFAKLPAGQISLKKPPYGGFFM